MTTDAATATHFTAWLTTDSSCLAGDVCDVVVLEDELLGEADDPRAWASTSKEHFQVETSVDARDGEHADAIAEAGELLEAAGWRIVGCWEPVGTGYTATVERA